MEYIDSWLVGNIDRDQIIYSLKIYEWNRIGKLIQYFSGLLILAEIIGHKRLNIYVKYLLQSFGYVKLKKVAYYAFNKSFLIMFSGAVPNVDDPYEIVNNSEELMSKIREVEIEHSELDSNNTIQKNIYYSFTLSITLAFTIIYFFLSFDDNIQFVETIVTLLFLIFVSWYVISPVAYVIIFSIFYLMALFFVAGVVRPTANILRSPYIDKGIKLFSVFIFSVGFFLDFFTS